jgi:hypothetical protein
LEALFTRRAGETVYRYVFEVKVPIDLRAGMEAAYVGFRGAVGGDLFPADAVLVVKPVNDGRA